VRCLVSYQSKYDKGLAKVDSIREEFPNFSAQENRGRTLFVQRCATCHLPGGQSTHFFMNAPLNNGLDADVVKTDGGVGDITLNPRQMGLFKSPSLRNVEFTGPYMHDGRFATLEAVIDHYAKGVKNHPNLDGRARRGNVDATQKAALVAFLWGSSTWAAVPRVRGPVPKAPNSFGSLTIWNWQGPRKKRPPLWSRTTRTRCGSCRRNY
jgi:cytochrome c peroxidase